MKKILLILFFVSSICYSQYSYNSGITQGENGYSKLTFNQGKVGSIPVFNVTPLYNQRAIDFFTRVTNAGKTLTDAQKSWYNDSIFVPLINAGIIGSTRTGDSLVFLYCFDKKHSGDSTVANMNLLADQYNCISYGGVTYSDSGVLGGTNKWINTGFNPSNDSSIYQLGSAMIGILCMKDTLASSKDVIGGLNDTAFSEIRMPYVDGTMYCYINSSSARTINGYSSRAVIMVIRQNLTTAYIGHNGIIYSYNTDNNVQGLTNVNIFICARNEYGTASNNSQNPICFGFSGSGLSGTKMTALSDILNNSLKGYGYNVY